MPTTPNLALPYPVGTDWVADGATAMENLAEAIDTGIAELGYHGRNVLLNGDASIWQRGTSISVSATDSYTADQWIVRYVGTYAFTVSQETSIVPVGAPRSLKITANGGNTPLATNYIWLSQKIEANNVQAFRKGTASARTYGLSFWVRSSVTGTYIAELVDEVNGRSVSQSYTITAADTWQKIRLIFPADTTGAIAPSTNAGLTLNLWLDAGSNFKGGTLATTWATTTSANRAVGQQSWYTPTTPTFFISEIQLEPEYNTEFEYVDIALHQLRCQRYYYRDSKTASGQPFGNGYNRTTSIGDFVFAHPVTMRAAPVMSFSAAANFVIRYLAATSIGTAIASVATSVAASHFSLTVSAVLTAGQGSIAQAGNNSAFIAVSAEL